jgi:hypothetical protein
MWFMWGTEELHVGLWLGDLMERDHLEDLGVDGDNIKMNLQEMQWRGMNWVNLAQERDRCEALLNAVINLGVSYNAANFLTS